MKISSLIFTAVLIPYTIFSSCKNESSSITTPDIIFTSTTILVAEDAPGAVVKLPVYLSEASDKIVTVDFATSDSTAIAGQDYVAVQSGKLTFNPGEKSKSISISILHNTDLKQDVYFRVVITNPVNASLNKTDMTIRVVNIDYATLVWSDEFTDTYLNTSCWNYELGNNNGWGNNEKEVYTNNADNVHLDSGYLHITVLNPSVNSYTSGRITTLGKKEFTYGRVEIRAKLPQGQGIWPALWMLGSNISIVGWPKCGEIDIMELLGQQPDKVYGTLHWDNSGHKSMGSNMTLSGGSFSNNFHIFTLIWTPNNFKWMIDNTQYFELTRTAISSFPFDLPEFFIFNVAVGGNWPGSPDGTTTFPQHLIVNYIKIYQ